MKLSIFSRMMIGYIALFALLIAVSSYAVVKIRKFNKLTQQILLIDSRILQHGKKMTDSILSQSRFERKFILTRDRALYDQFLSGKETFHKMLNEALAIADTPYKKNVLEIWETLRWLSIRGGWRDKTRSSNRDYRKKGYEEEKEKQVDLILDELEILEEQSRQDIVARMEMLGEAGSSARRMVIGMSVTAIVLVLVTSFLLPGPSIVLWRY